MAAAVLALSAMAWVDPVIMLTTNDYNEASWPVVVQIVALTAAAFLFAYAILRHRAVDLGFAVNRTLVYSVLSGAMLAGFALAEKAAEKLLPEGAHNTSVLVQAAIALGIFMVFHRARDAVEHGVERVFFAQWRDAEAKLKTFIRQAHFITKPMRLVDRTVEELAAYSGGADVAVYQLINGDYRRLGGVVGGMRRRIDLDEPAIVALRAERELQRGGLGEAALLLPMVQRAEIIGFIALGAKRDGAPYRPDEEALLMTAAQDIGFDLHALRVEDLQANNRRLSEKVASFAMA
jgi:hypothetical protein